MCGLRPLTEAPIRQFHSSISKLIPFFGRHREASKDRKPAAASGLSAHAEWQMAIVFQERIRNRSILKDSRQTWQLEKSLRNPKLSWAVRRAHTRFLSSAPTVYRENFLCRARIAGDVRFTSWLRSTIRNRMQKQLRFSEGPNLARDARSIAIERPGSRFRRNPSKADLYLGCCSRSRKSAIPVSCRDRRCGASGWV
jgi:hypothetical protein